VVGWVHVFAQPMLVAEHTAEIGGLIVGEGYRSGGIGQRLLAAAEDWARAHGLTHLYVRSNVIRERAHRFYEREGYETTKRQRIFHKAL
jgi:GNAT superfamily N-acetyltransferase